MPDSKSNPLDPSRRIGQTAQILTREYLFSAILTAGRLGPEQSNRKSRRYGSQLERCLKRGRGLEFDA
eukprot:1057328-Amorphochlora_amoeboformis.AAC.1